MLLHLLLTVLLAGWSQLALAVVEYGPAGAPPATIRDVYLRDGVAYVAIDEVLAPLGLTGAWDSVEHLYRIETPAGTAVISPGSQFLRVGDRYIPLQHRPRFLDGRLRVPEELAAEQLPRLLRREVTFVNLNPGVSSEPAKTAGTLDQFFGALFNRQPAQAGERFRLLALDAGHGGSDPGVIGPGGVKEKEVALAVARQLEKRVKMEWGVPVHLCRDGDYSLSQQRRVEELPPTTEALLLLHAQGAFGPGPRGVTLFVRPGDSAAGGESLRLARELEAALRADGLTVAGIEEAALLPLGRGNLPTVLVELGYLSNPQDLALLAGAGQERLATALYRGVRAFAKTFEEQQP